VAPLNEPPPAPPQRALVEQIAERGAQLRSRIAELTDRDVAVVCVTKGHPVEVAAAAVAAGFTRLGENYAQELRDKAAALGGAVTREPGPVQGGTTMIAFVTDPDGYKIELIERAA